jgi:uncharacterized lipoprotein
MPAMRSLCLILLLALSTPGCSHFSQSSRAERDYNKYLKRAKVAREKQQKQVIRHQRAELPSLRKEPPPVEQNVEPAPENQ